MKTFAIVVGLVTDGEKVLMLKRAAGRRHASGKWEPVSGFFREHEGAETAVVREVWEETGLATEIVRAGAAIELEDDGAQWIIKPFLLRQTSEAAVRIEREHDDLIWATPANVLELDCVGGMRADFEALGLLPTEAPARAAA